MLSLRERKSFSIYLVVGSLSKSLYLTVFFYKIDNTFALHESLYRKVVSFVVKQHLILKMLCNSFSWEVNQAVSFLILHISCLDTDEK